MKELIVKVLPRLKEPSSWAAIAIFIVGGVWGPELVNTAEVKELIATGAAFAAAAAAFLLKEKGDK